MPRVQTFTVEGKLVHKFEVQQITETFSKRSIVVCIEHEQYPQEVKMDCVGGAKSHVDAIEIGSYVHCECELTGKSYVRKNDGEKDWFTAVKCFHLWVPAPGSRPNEQGEVEDVPF